MSDALSIAASGLKSEEYFIDKIANDIANLNTPNYKASKLSFSDVLYQNIDSKHVQQSSIKIGLGTAIIKSTKDFSQGPLKAGTSWNDLAIDGNGFFQVLQADGSLAYTRSSSFSIDSEGYLCTADGLRLSDNIQIPEDYTDIIIQKNGDVEMMSGTDSEPQSLGTISLARFADPGRLNPVGSGLFQATADSGDCIVDNPGSNGMGQLLQKQIEASNVDMVASLMQLTMAQRVYQLNAKTVQIADELEKMINELRD
ncbi:hypothetical protein Lbir_2900 [Legionella birminghamensis]|uniref:Flagellar basal-body rod protein FlgG n=1 Tax=Legionella birminghamensis TaxID=28083 RepID=A0A378I739_9GAMM|nr:flagellar hook-basal body complex protein [Legionella birminghamensis]KTC68298.1 hypothetical protein Lbir_2900 [Legionella birminghamensis]STX30989.1 flagellar basal-body rod protein FlgG [Legionella birminghamensis]